MANVVMANVVLLVDSSRESLVAQMYLDTRMVSYVKASIPEAEKQSQPCPTLLVYGVAYTGWERIKLAVDIDHNLYKP